MIHPFGGNCKLFHPIPLPFRQKFFFPGGAGFPTAVKLAPKNLDEIDVLVINGAECEPYITSDNRWPGTCPQRPQR